MRIRRVARIGFLFAGVATAATMVGVACAGASGGAETRYEVTVQFTTEATQRDIDEAGALLESYGEDLDFTVMEIFPPIGRAFLSSDQLDFCALIQPKLEAKGYVDDASCRPAVEHDVDDPDAPVSSDSDAP